MRVVKASAGGEAEDRFEDYGTAFELQRRALQQSPDDPVVRFNRAITASRLFLFKQSMEDFTRYLGMDSSGGWADEARQHLSEVKEIVDAHDRRTKAPLLTPAEFVDTVVPSRRETWEKVNPRIEEYLSLAITEWLPAAFPVKGKGPALSEARQALEILALILRNSHGSWWAPQGGGLVASSRSLSHRFLAYTLSLVFYHRQVCSHARRKCDTFHELAKHFAYWFLALSMNTS
jgi:hypothetical protein